MLFPAKKIKGVKKDPKIEQNLPNLQQLGAYKVIAEEVPFRYRKQNFLLDVRYIKTTSLIVLRVTVRGRDGQIEKRDRYAVYSDELVFKMAKDIIDDYLRKKEIDRRIEEERERKREELSTYLQSKFDQLN